MDYFGVNECEQSERDKQEALDAEDQLYNDLCARRVELNKQRQSIKAQIAEKKGWEKRAKQALEIKKKQVKSLTDQMEKLKRGIR